MAQPARCALTFSVLLRPAAVPPASRGWLPLLAGVAVAAGLHARAGLEVSLKWPNDVLTDQGKLAGILAEQTGTAIVVGIGLNVSQRRDELPVTRQRRPGLLARPGPTGRRSWPPILAELERWYQRWSGGPHPGDAAVSGLRAEYLRYCATVGKEVRVELPGGGVLTGRAMRR